MRKFSTLFLSLYVIFLVFLVVSIALEGVTSWRETVIFSTPYGNVEAFHIVPKGWKADVIAIGIPGFMEPTKLFNSIGNVLAQEGIESYFLSLPGFGKTTVQFRIDLRESLSWRYHTGKVLNQTIVPTFNYIIEQIKQQRPNAKIILLGSGMGGGAALRLNLVRDDIAATIIWAASGWTEDLMVKLKGKIKNFLYLIGAMDDPNYIEEALLMLKLLGVENPEVDKLYGSFENGTAKMVAHCPLSGSIFHYIAYSSLSEIAEWVSKTTGIPKTSAMLEYSRLVIFVMSIFLLALSSFLMPSLLSEVFKVYSGGKRWPKPEMKVRAVKMAIIWTFALIVLSLAFSLLILVFHSKMVLSGNGFEFPVYPILLVSWSLATWVLARFFISKFMGVPSRRVHTFAISEVLRDKENVLLALLGLAFIMLPAMVWVNEILADVFVPDATILALFIITWPVNFWALLLYEILFRRVLQESFGGATFEAAFLAAAISTSLRMVIPALVALIYFFLGGFVLFPFILLAVLFVAELTVELIAATLYFATREVLPGALINSILWYYFAYVITVRVVMVVPFMA